MVNIGLYRFGRGRTLLFEDTIPELIPVAAGSKMLVYGSSLAGIGDSNPIGGTGVSLVSAVCLQEEVSVWG